MVMPGAAEVDECDQGLGGVQACGRAGQGDRREAHGFLAAEVGGYGCGTLRDQLIVELVP